MKRNRLIILLILLSSVLVFWCFTPSSQAITVGPPKLEYSVDPGDTIKDELFLMNEGQELVTFYPVFEKFTEENGQKVFLKEESDLAAWVKTDDSITLKPGEQRKIPFTIEIPQNASPGGHFAVIWWSTAPPVSEGGAPVSIVTRAGILVLLRVSGDIKEEGRILSFSSGKKFFWSFPITFTTVFMNDSNVYVKPGGKITIKNIFGFTKTVVTVNKGALQILPQSRRVFDEKWELSRFALGPYKAELNLVFGESQKKLSQTFWFWVFPVKPLLIVILLLILIFFIIPKGIKKYNQWIIKRYAK